MLYSPYNLNTENIVIKKQIYHNLYPIKYKYSNPKITNLIFQTPTMYIPFGITEFNNNSNSNSTNKYIDLSFMNKNNYKNIEELKTFIETITDFFKHKIKHFKFIHSLKQNSTFFPPLLRLNFNNNKDILIFNEDNEKIDYTYIKPKTYGKFIIQLSNIWINKDTLKYGLIFNIAQIKLFVNLTYIPKTLKFIDDISNSNTNSNTNNSITYKEKYSKYFTMLNRGIPLFAVKQKLLIDNLDQTIIDTPNKLVITIETKTQIAQHINKNGSTSMFSQIKLGAKLNKTTKTTKEKIIDKYKSDSPMVPSKSAILFAKQNLKNINIL